ncbi:plasmid replication protein RepC [Cognatishimia sp. WU-CL00825]|uniref:plasmid replication protein RepC n=1 Tax=Cognatishimia sp. WU-CL00825 TaxID=3127658 RepID=UPI003102C9A3
MEVLTTTPFGQRPVTAGLIKRAKATRAGAALAEVSKWDIMRELTVAKKHFGLNASALTVLNALLSFHRGDILADTGALVVFPSNRTLAGRAHGMPESTLRRNLNVLIKAGLIARHDSPNGKRYAVRGQGGDITRAFGFDLRPLLVKAVDIHTAATDALKLAAETKRRREKTALMKRDCWKLLEFARTEGLKGDWNALEEALTAAGKQMRRVLTIAQLDALCGALSETLERFEILFQLKPTKTDEMTACDTQNERHIQSSNKDKFDSETGIGNAKQPEATASEPETIPIALVLQACPDITPYSATPIQRKHELVETAHFLHSMMGITSEVWQSAMKTMGSEAASVALACILQRIDKIKNPGGYLRVLSQKAENGAFSVWPMIRALLGKEMRC